MPGGSKIPAKQGLRSTGLEDLQLQHNDTQLAQGKIDMIGIILAAGIGSRLRPMTNTKPKCLVTSAGKPILEYQIDAYIEAGVQELVIVVGYESDAIRNYCKHIKGVEIHIVENSDYETTNNMYSLYLVRDLAEGKDFILNNADLTIDKSIVSELVRYSPANAIAVDSSMYNSEAMKLVVDESGRADGVPVSLMEAMLMGRPVVTTRVTGIPELVEDGIGGLLVPPRDASALADAIERVRNEAGLAERLVSAGRLRVQEDYDLQRNVSRLRDLFLSHSGSVATRNRSGAMRRATPRKELSQ